MTKYEFNVEMSCGGCSKAVTNALNKVQVNADLTTQLVTVEATTDSQVLLEAIKKTGKKCSLKA